MRTLCLKSLALNEVIWVWQSLQSRENYVLTCNLFPISTFISIWALSHEAKSCKVACLISSVPSFSLTLTFTLFLFSFYLFLRVLHSSVSTPAPPVCVQAVEARCTHSRSVTATPSHFCLSSGTFCSVETPLKDREIWEDRGGQRQRRVRARLH